MSRPTAIVVGGSLGGLNAALNVRDAGFSVEVLERSRSPLLGQGAGIVLNPATVRYLVDHDVVDLAAVSLATGVLRYLDASGDVAAEHPEPYRFASYDALYRALMGALGSERYRLGSDVVGFSGCDGDPVSVTLASGASQRADLLVCADGVRSASRARLAPDAATSYAGYVAWRGTAGAGRLSTAARAAFDGAITYCVMPNSHALVYAIPGPGGGDHRLNWLWYRNVSEGAELDLVMTDRAGRRRDISLPPGLVPESRLRALRADAAVALPPPIAEVVAATPEPFIQAVVDIEVPRMAAGRVCLIGDAAFALRPHAAAGAAKAAEDAYRLGRALADADGDVTTALAAWEPGQLDLGRAVMARTRAAGRQSQFDNTWAVGQPLPFGLYAAGDSAMAAA